MNATPEAIIRRTLRTAMRGDVSALGSLEGLSQTNRSVLTRSLPIVSRHIQAPTPQPPFSSAVPTPAEELAIHSLKLLFVRVATQDNEDEAETEAVNAVLSAEITKILRWMSYLFTRWVVDREPEYSDISPPELRLARDPLRLNIITLTAALSRMAQNPTTVDVMKNSIQLGTLLAQMTLVSARDGLHTLLIFSRMFSRTLVGSDGDVDPNCPYGSAFFEHLELHPHIFARGIVIQIREYDQSPMDHIQEFHHTLPHLIQCIAGHDIILDACLEQAGTVRVLTSIFVELVYRLEEDWTTHGAQPATDVVQVILYLTNIIWICFDRGGALLVATSLDRGLLSAVLSLYKTVAAEELTSQVLDYLNTALVRLLKIIFPFIAYPCVLTKALNFRPRIKPEKVSSTRKLVNLNTELRRLSSRIRQESALLSSRRAMSGPDDGEASYSSNPYKFCDNTACPELSARTAKLGRCIKCQSGYYCSSSCQRAVWKNGHRQECKEIAASIQGGRDGFPSVFTIHDREYFTRTLMTRFHHYVATSAPADAAPGSSQHQPLTERSVVEVDLTTEHVRLNYGNLDDLEMDVTAGPLIVGRFPTGRKLGGMVQISLAGMPIPHSQDQAD